MSDHKTDKIQGNTQLTSHTAFFSICNQMLPVNVSMAEWSNATDLSSVPFEGAGSNPAGHTNTHTSP